MSDGRLWAATLALVVVLAGTAAASHDQDPGPGNALTYGTYEGVSFQDKGTHGSPAHSLGYTLTKHGSFVVGPGGELFEQTFQTGIPVLGSTYRVTTNETLTAVIDPPANHCAVWRAELRYDEGVFVDLPPTVGDMQQNDFGIRVVDEVGDVLDADDDALDGGRELIDGVAAGPTVLEAQAWSNRGASPVKLMFDVDYKDIGSGWCT